MRCLGQGLIATKPSLSDTIAYVAGMDRRGFLRQTAAGLAATTAGRPSSAATTNPPHDPVEVPGVHAYAERSLQAGQSANFRVSSDVPYDLTVGPAGAGDAIARVRERRPAVQAIHPGSYVHVATGFEGTRFSSVTIETWVRAWSSESRQGIVTACDGESGFGLFVAQGGWAEVLMGSRRVYRAALPVGRWRHFAVTWDGSIAALFVNGRFQASWRQSGPIETGDAPIRLGAAGKGGAATEFLDGDIAMPAIHARALSAAEVMERYEARAMDIPLDGVLACWPLDEDRGTHVRDAAGDRDGVIINRGTWMIGGPSFDASSVPRYGDYDPAADSSRGHGLRLASDDLYDCRWETTHSVPIPADAKPGVYVGRFAFRRQGKRLRYDVTFLVRRGEQRPKAPILMLCSTNTWQAYSATPFAVNSDEAFWGTTGQENAHERAPAYCCYRDHAHGQPTYAVGMKLPWPVAGPEVIYTRDRSELDYSHLARGELFAHRWLDNNGYEYDVASDHDLHLDPGQLAGYKVIFINGHSEYWSQEAYEAVDRFLLAGGAAIVMSGNTMFWRVSYDEDGTAMECRKHGTDIGGRNRAHVGEIFHSHDQRRGSLMRFCGLPAWGVLGLECVGWWGVSMDSFGTYTVANADHFLFREPEDTGLEDGDTFGAPPGRHQPRAGGHECDIRPSLVKAITKQVQDGYPVPSDPPGIVPLAQMIDKDRRGLDYFGRWEPLEHGVFAELTYWERPQGGRVLHTGCIAGGWALSEDPRMQKLTRNALHHFGVPKSA